MLQPSRLGYLAFDVADLESSTLFYQDLVHLEVIAERDDSVFLRGGIDHHWIVLRQSNIRHSIAWPTKWADEQYLDEM